MRNIIALCLALFACGRPESKVGSADAPLVMVLSPSYQEKVTPEDLTTLSAFLQQETKLTITVQVAKDEVDAIESFSGRADVGLLNIFEYLLARQEYNVTAGLQVIRSGASSYRGEIVVKKDSPLSNLKDLNGKRIAYVDAYSSSGYVFPAQMLSREKISAAPVFAGSPEKALEMLNAGQVDAAAVYQGLAPDASYKALGSTESIPNEPIFFRGSLAQEKRDVLLSALQKLIKTPDGVRIFAKLSGITELRVIAGDSYNEVSASIQSTGQSVSDLVQNGWRVNQPSAELIP